MKEKVPVTTTLHQLVRLMDKYAEKILQDEFSISYSWFLILATIAIIEPSTQHFIAETLNYSDAAVSRLVVNLKDHGLISVEPDPSHGRRSIVRITDEGRSLVTRSNVKLEEAFAGALEAAKVDPLTFEESVTSLLEIMEMGDE